MQGLWLDNAVTRFDDGSQIGPVSLDVAKGTMLSLLGASGSGKTTTLRLIAGLEPLVSGEIYFSGTNMSHLHPSNRKVGMVFQNFGLFPHMTVEKNISFGLRMKRIAASVISEKVTSMCRVMRLEGLEQRFVQQLSGGQKQRVALARTLIMDPDILLLDEPLSNLDANLRFETATFIREMQQRLGITTVFVTHDQEEALLLADQVAVMTEGSIAQVGTPFDISERPKTTVVAEFMGGSNIFDGKVENETQIALGNMKLLGTVENLKQFPHANKFLIRAENIELHINSADENKMNFIRGEIIEARYIGGFMSYKVKAHNLVLDVREKARTQLKIGAQVTVAIDPEDIWPLEA